MKYLKYYENKGVDEEKVFDYFMSNLRDSIFMWDYFVDFGKVKENIKKIEKELNLLNYLLGKSNLENEFIKLIKEYPNIRRAFPILIAIRKNKLKEVPIIIDIESLESQYKSYILTEPLTDNILDELLIFFRESGLKQLFEDKDVKNLPDYCFGVEVGLDTNARKNRTGFLMEKIVGHYLNKYCDNNQDCFYISQANKKHVKDSFNIEIEVDKSNRIFDFVLYNKEKNKIFIIEVNFYSSQGSKLKATAGEYQYLNDFLKKQGIDLIWITDGLCWNSAKSALEETVIHNDYVFNLDMIEKEVLKEIVM